MALTPSLQRTAAHIPFTASSPSRVTLLPISSLISSATVGRLFGSGAYHVTPGFQLEGHTVRIVILAKITLCLISIGCTQQGDGNMSRAAAEHYNRGLAWDKKGEYDKAIADYTEAIQLDPKLAPAFNNRGLAWDEKGEHDKAIADYNEANRLDPRLVKPN